MARTQSSTTSSSASSTPHLKRSDCGCIGGKVFSSCPECCGNPQRYTCAVCSGEGIMASWCGTCYPSAAATASAVHLEVDNGCNYKRGGHDGYRRPSNGGPGAGGLVGSA
ncbi:MAG: hypothetical protein M1829_002266 [Trizodia sp. TS-e1964]|nr:MAG: hypothetical protein M1829_002266 [Trizodia sp. TS-e1964]